MNKTFYRWLLVSLAAHIIILSAVKSRMMTGLAIPGSQPALLDVILIPTPDSIPLPVVIPPRLITPPVQPSAPSLPVGGVPTQGLRESPNRGVTGMIGTTRPSAQPAPRNPLPAVAPSTITSSTGAKATPTGNDQGSGSQATGPVTPDSGGPTYGATVKGYYRPILSKEAQNLNEEGTVVISLAISATGAVTDVEFISKTPYADLNNAAMRAAKKLRYAPAMQQGLPAASSDTVTYTFKDGQATVH